MAEIHKLKPATKLIPARPSNERSSTTEATLHTFSGLDFAEMRRIMEKHGFSTKGLPGARE